MNVNLTNQEIELIDKALCIWEQEPHSSSFMAGIFSAMMGKQDNEATLSAQFENRRKSAEEEIQKRRIQRTLLCAKLYQAQTRDSEHALESSGPAPGSSEG